MEFTIIQAVKEYQEECNMILKHSGKKYEVGCLLSNASGDAILIAAALKWLEDNEVELRFLDKRSKLIGGFPFGYKIIPPETLLWLLKEIRHHITLKTQKVTTI